MPLNQVLKCQFTSIHENETFVILRGKVRVTTHNDDGSIIENIVLCSEEGRYGVNIPKRVWHTIEVMEPSSFIFECKESPSWSMKRMVS